MKLTLSQYIVLIDTLQRSLTYASWPGCSDAEREEVLHSLLDNELTIDLHISDYRTALSKRLVSIIDGIADGKPRQQIANELHISYPTLKRSIRTILNHYGASNMAEAMAQIKGV